MTRTAPSLTLPRGGGLVQFLYSALKRSWRGTSFFSPFFLSLLFLACSPSRPRGILSEDKMTDVLVDIHLAQGMAEAQGANVEVERYKYIQAVFRKHRISEAEFDSSMIYYSGKAEDFTHLYNDVVTRVRAQAERMGLEATAQDQFASLTNEGDTANIWLGKDFACVVSNQVGCIYSFQLKADSTFRPGDSFIWRFKSQFVARSMNNEAIALLNLYYDTDTVATVNQLIHNSTKNELRYDPVKETDTLGLRSVMGFIYLPMSRTDPPKPLLISEIKLIRMHKVVIPEGKAEQEEDLDSLDIDSVGLDTTLRERNERLTPLQMRESQPRRRTIHVTKENPNPIHPQKGIPERRNRRRR